MHKRLSLLIIGGFMALAASGAQAATDGIVVPLNRSELVTLPQDMTEVIISNPAIADVHVHGPRKASIVGKSVGTTNIKFFDKDANVIKESNVTVSYDIPAIRKTLKEFLPYEKIGVEVINTNVALTGEVSSASAADSAIKIVNQFVGASAEGGPQVLNFLKVVSGQQVMLRVRVGEIQRTALKKIGVGLQAISGNFSIGTGTGVGNNLGSFTDAGDTFGSIAGSGSSGFVDIAANLQALERDGLFKVLAEPNLVSSSGEKAEFLAGGEFPIPNAQDGEIEIEFKPYGVAVSFIPYVLSENKIRLVVQPEVSELSDEGSVEVNGFRIPGIITRRAGTTVELAPGESFMIAGLMSDRTKSTIDSIPGAKEVPILSALFRSTEFQRNETELVIAVTPYLVDPMKSADVRMPTDNFAPASLMDMVFYGNQAAVSKKDRILSQTPALEGPLGFMVD